MLRVQGRSKDIYRALSSGNTAPPTNPQAGDVHIVGVGATGAWLGQDCKVARFTGTRWEFIAAENGSEIWLAGGFSCRFHNGVWHKMADLAIPQGPPGDVGSIGPQGPAGPQGPPVEAEVKTGSAQVTTTSKSALGVPIAGMLWTPPAGTYLVAFSSITRNLSAYWCQMYAYTVYTFIAVDGVKQPNSLREIPTPSQVEVTVNGNQVVQAYWYVKAGTGSMTERTLSFLEVT